MLIVDNNVQGPLSLEPGMDSRSLATAVRGFERSLSDLEAFIMPHCDKLMVRFHPDQLATVDGAR